MNGFAKLILPLAGTLVLVGCAGMELQKAQEMSPQGSEFNTSLYEGYVGLSASEFAEGDYRDSDTFAVRAIGAGSDQLIGPEQIDGRRLPDDNVSELMDARHRLALALATGAKEKNPAEAARAQVSFDCWMQEQEENRQPEHIARCRDDMMAALDILETKPVAMAPVPKAEPAPPPPPMAPETFLVFFAFDSVKLVADSEAVLDNVMKAAKMMGTNNLAITGHADRAGPEEYNLALSLRRASAVLDALAARGGDPAAISLAGRGEAEPAVPTADDVSEPANRRVEIIVLP